MPDPSEEPTGTDMHLDQIAFVIHRDRIGAARVERTDDAGRDPNDAVALDDYGGRTGREKVSGWGWKARRWRAKHISRALKAKKPAETQPAEKPPAEKPPAENQPAAEKGYTFTMRLSSLVFIVMVSKAGLRFVTHVLD
jgi:hypothetical protein